MKTRISIFILILAMMMESGYSEITGSIRVAVIRAEFSADDSQGTTGNGRFLLEEQNYCPDLQVDPPPHDRNYFYSHLKATDNYYRAVSGDKFGIDLINSNVFPEDNFSAYSLDRTMDHYHPFDQDSIHEKRLTELFRDAVTAAYETDGMDLDQYDLIMVVHPGTGQDFELPFLDPTPEDIPSAFIDPGMILEHLGIVSIEAGQASVKSGIILPETQNLLLYEDTAPIFEGTNSPCDYQYSLTGTMALMIGFHEGIPPLWNTESGVSMVGVFSLMDQGSNNLSGMVPAIPDAWTRIYAGWDDPKLADKPGEYEVGLGEGVSDIIKIPVNSYEYFLIENRLNWFMDSTGITEFQVNEYDLTGSYSSDLEILFNESEAVFDDNGILTSVRNYDMGLPGSGILIWHVNELVIANGIDTYMINSSASSPGIDLVEADGAQDIGYPSVHVFTDPSAGYFGDMWYLDNPEYIRANPDMEGKAPVFSNETMPSSVSFSGGETSIHLTINGAPDSVVIISLSYGHSILGAADPGLNILTVGDLNGDGNDEVIGFNDSLWWSPITEFDPKRLQYPGTNVTNIVFGGSEGLAVLEEKEDSLSVRLYSYNENKSSIELIDDISVVRNGPYFIDADQSVEDYALYFEDITYFIEPGSVSESVGLPYTHEVSVTWADNEESKYSIVNNGFAVKDHSTGQIKQFDTRLLFISAGDLDWNGLPEICILDNLGQIHVLNQNLTFYSGFPAGSGLVSPILIGDVFGDEDQEIIAKQMNGDIYVYSSDGSLIRVLSDPEDEPLRGLGVNDGVALIISAAGIYKLSDAPSGGIDWSSVFGNNWNTREIKLKEGMQNGIAASVLDLKRTYAYPNPSMIDRVTFRITPGSATSADIKVYDLAGQLVWDASNIDMHSNGVPVDVIWNTVDIESGLYIARVTGENGSGSTDKILKIGIIQ